MKVENEKTKELELENLILEIQVSLKTIIINNVWKGRYNHQKIEYQNNL